MVSSAETPFKNELAPILDLFLHLPTNTPHSTNVSQRIERGLGLSKGTNEDKCVVVERVMTMKIPTSLPMKPLVPTLTTTTTNAPQINVD